MENNTAEVKLRQENARKAKESADKFFPGENWKQVEEGIYLSSRRPIGKHSSYQNELRDAQILRDLGSTVYLVSEPNTEGRKYDAIVDGLRFEFKNVGGNANTLEHQFLRSRSQSPNVFINLETSNLTRRQIMSTLYGARNKVETDTSHGYSYYNKFKGGRIILKIKGYDSLIYVSVNDLKAHKQKNTGRRTSGYGTRRNIATPAPHLDYRTFGEKSQAFFDGKKVPGTFRRDYR